MNKFLFTLLDTMDDDVSMKSKRQLLPKSIKNLLSSAYYKQISVEQPPTQISFILVLSTILLISMVMI
jgi:hypothetical protein